MVTPFFKRKEAADKPPKPGLVQRMQEAEEPAAAQEQEPAAEPQNGMVSTGKTPLDKKSLDLIFAVEQMIQARTHAETKSLELQDRLTHSNGSVERLNKDLKNLSKVIEEREKNIMELEQKLVEKNLKVDQVLEDYRELQAEMLTEADELRSTIDLEQQKYAHLVQKHNEAHAEKLKRINELEEKIGRLETENAHLKQKFETARQEKTYLANMIADFTNRMTVPFGAGSAQEPSEPGGDS
ncbi:hypothetical protein [Paenibacillus sp. NFR01]|uniref:hypothetical protein n=1 Tax=Paenibacillus sp. NFR01 TaxID=1566279 RepID=UPI0008AB25DA|nr:hypothetical protein [Paenibacillus sp. NFR01]SEU11156.1 hypothetical protein SAMN03159358_3377 [Paenibacillus sp. NFR01]